MHWTRKYKKELDKFLPRVNTVIGEIRAIPDNPAIANFLIDIFIRLTRRFEKVFYGGIDNPLVELEKGIEWLSEQIDMLIEDFDNTQYTEYVKCSSDNGAEVKTTGFSSSDYNENGQSIGIATGNYYGTIFSSFTAEQCEEVIEFMKQRLKKNEVDHSWFDQKSGLDAGCGSGRYTIAFSRMNAKNMIGVDSGIESLNAAKRSAELMKVKNVDFQLGDVINLEFENNSFDFVLSNGVLHHTNDMEQGIREAYRVLKQGGYLWLQLYGDSLFWRINDIFRSLGKKTSSRMIFDRMTQIGYTPNKIFLYLDNSHVPICNTYYWDDIEKIVKGMGFKIVKRLVRDVETKYFVYDNEQIYQKLPFADLRWGEGSIKLLLSKK